MNQESALLPCAALDDRPISLRTTLAGALNRQPSPYIAQVAAQLNLPPQPTKRRQVIEIVRTLADPFSLFHRIERLPTLTRRLLKTVLEQGGWVPLAMVERAFAPAANGDSPLRQARLHAVAHVGIAQVNDGALGVVVIPPELREALDKILALEPVVDLESDVAELARILATVTDDVAAGNVARIIPLAAVEQYLTSLSREAPQQLLGAWLDIQAILSYCATLLADDLPSLDALAEYHISEFAQQSHAGVDAAQRRRRLDTWAAWFAMLAAAGLIQPETASRVAAAVQTITAPPRRLAKIPRPTPLGGEPVLQLEDQRVTFSFNDLWLVQAAQADYAGDLRALQEAATGVPDGAVKRKRIDWLIKQPLTALLEHAAGLSAASQAAARRWFHHQTFNRGNAWLPTTTEV